MNDRDWDRYLQGLERFERNGFKDTGERATDATAICKQFGCCGRCRYASHAVLEFVGEPRRPVAIEGGAP